MTVLCGVTQYSIRLETVGYPRTSCLLPTFDDAYHVPVLSDVSVICRVTYF